MMELARHRTWTAPRPVSPDIYHNDASATHTYPDYLDEVRFILLSESISQ